MYTSKPKPWVIAELARQRRVYEWQRDDRPFAELPLPPLPLRDPPEKGATRAVIVIDLT